VSDVLRGLHAAHEARNEHGESLHLVHRDVSPHNILVGADGSARVLDFGVAKATGRLQTTQSGVIKGKLAYMAPEQLNGLEVTRQADIFSAAVVLWEALAGARLFPGDGPAVVMSRFGAKTPPPASAFASEVEPRIDAVVARGLETEPGNRYASALEMALDIEAVIGGPSRTEVAEWVASLGGQTLADRAAAVAALERGEGPLRGRVAPALTEPAKPHMFEPTTAFGRGPTEAMDRSSQVGPLVSRAPAPPSRFSTRAAAALGALATIVISVGASIVVVRTRHAPASAPAVSVAEPSPPALASGELIAPVDPPPPPPPSIVAPNPPAARSKSRGLGSSPPRAHAPLRPASGDSPLDRIGDSRK
jgi:serine/threonine-protein kinase